MKKYDLLQTLERLYPDREDWFISDEDEGHVVVCFSIEEEQTDET